MLPKLIARGLPSVSTWQQRIKQRIACILWAPWTEEFVNRLLIQRTLILSFMQLGIGSSLAQKIGIGFSAAFFGSGHGTYDNPLSAGAFGVVAGFLKEHTTPEAQSDEDYWQMCGRHAEGLVAPIIFHTWGNSILYQTIYILHSVGYTLYKVIHEKVIGYLLSNDSH